MEAGDDTLHRRALQVHAAIANARRARHEARAEGVSRLPVLLFSLGAAKWLVIGLVVYFTYSVKHSRVQQALRSAK